MSAKATSDLIKLVEKRASDVNSWKEAQQLINQGADIEVPTKTGSMIDSVLNEAARHQQVFSGKAEYCLQLAQVLQSRASTLLATSVLSSTGGNLGNMGQLIRLRANCYQSDKFGPLGLIGELLKQEKTPIRLDIVQFLVENDQTVKFGLMRVNDKWQTCLSLAKSNSKCPEDVRQFIQDTIDMTLNQIPKINPRIDINEVVQWIQYGANPEAVDANGNTVLLNAVLINNQALVEKLIGIGCNTAYKNKDNLTALELAQNATPRNAQLEAILRAHFINTQLKQLIETRKSLLTFDEVNALLEKGAKINTPIANKSTFLHLLIANEGTPEMITTFVNDFNADISAMDINGYRPIETCILLDQSPYTILQTYLNLPTVATNAYFNPKLNRSVLQFAKEQNRSEAAKIIQDTLNRRLWNTIKRTTTNDEYNRSLVPELGQLIKYGAQLAYQHTDEEYDRWTIMHLACKLATKLFVQSLIEQVIVDYTVANGNGDFPLAIAAEYGHLTTVNYLHGLPNVSLNVSNIDKQTPLHLATKNHHLRVVRYLVQWGADYQAENAAKQTPLDVARANTSNNKQDEMTDKALIHFLEQLICPPIDPTDQQQDQPNTPAEDIDACEVVQAISVPQIERDTLGEEEKLGQQSKGFFAGNVNDTLLTAAREGSIIEAKTAIGQGANICYRRNNYNAYEIAVRSAADYRRQSATYQAKSPESLQLTQKMTACQQIAEDLRHTAYKRLVQAIDESKAYRVVAYHQAGAPLSAGLLSYTCTKSDNVQIVDYLLQHSPDNFQEMFNCTTKESPYQIAKKNKFSKVAAYLKYRLSIECTKAIQGNDLESVKKLIRAGASVNMQDTNNLQVAIGHRNLDMVYQLVKSGVKMPMEWLQSKGIVLPNDISKTMDSAVVLQINRSLINRRLRFAAGSGDLPTVIHCQHMSADINSINCHGTTPLLCSIQHGNYFPIVHALISRGAIMLHANENESISLIALAKKKNYKQITEYLSQTLNVQFLITILNNDIRSAERLESLGADFNYQDAEKRTALHYAVQYHGIELVSWLCVRGATPTVADINGNYPMTDAAEKGDYAVVESFATNYPATKQQKTKAGLTALQIAQKQGFKRIAYVLETGKSAPVSLGDDKPATSGPKHSREQLMYAAKNGHLKVIKEFIEDRYESRDEKRRLCFQLIDVAKRSKQQEVVGILQPYFENQLKVELPSDINMDSGIRLNQYYKKILMGFLTSLGRVIAESPVVLNPADPNTYNDLFSNLTANQQQRIVEIRTVDSERDAKKLSEQDISNLNEKLSNISEELMKLSEAKEKLEQSMQETGEKLKNQELTARQLQDLFKQQEEHKKQLAVYECSVSLCELKQEATMTRQNTVNFFRKQENTNMYLFFRTIENLLQALFHGTLAARSGLVTTKMNSNYGTAHKIIEKVPLQMIPVVGDFLGGPKSGINAVLLKLDEKKQKKEYYNISTLGNIEELQRIASDTASLITLYYKEQILSIDTTRIIVGSNKFNGAMRWIRETAVDVRPEGSEEMPVIIVAEYITALIIDTLKGGKSKGLKVTEPIPQQLWLSVAKENYAEQGITKTVSDTMGATVGRQMIPVRIYKDSGEKILIRVQLRYLIGCVSVVTEEGIIYQYNASKESSKEDFADLEVFGYVYVTPFIVDDESVKSIIDGRKLIEATKDENYDVLTKLKDIEEYVRPFQSQGDHDRQLATTAETARQVAQVLREQRAFVDPRDVQSLLETSRDEIEITIKGYREDIQAKADYYQTTIESTKEQLQNDLTAAKETLKQDNAIHYNDTSRKINEQLKQIEKTLENYITERMNTIENQLKSQCDDMRKIVDTAKSESNQAVAKANEAIQISEQSVLLTEQAREDVKKLSAATEQRRQEFQEVMDRCERIVKQTLAEEKKFCEQSITAARTKVQQDFERAKQSAEQALANAKESAQAAKDSAKAAQETQKDTRKQLDLQKEETTKVIAEAKEISKQSVRTTDEAKEANKQAKQTIDASTVTLKKMEESYRKMETGFRDEIRKIVDTAKSDSDQALAKATEAVQLSKQSAQLTEQAREDVKTHTAATEQRREEFQDVMDRCERIVKQTLAEEKKFCEQSITAARTKVQQDFERAKQSAEQALTNVRESAQAANDSAKAAQETQKDTRRQLDLQKEESNRIISEAKETSRQGERTIGEAREANKQARQTIDASTAGLKKVEEMHRKIEAALERLEKLSRKIESKMSS